MITLKNMRYGKPRNAWDYRCDRANKILGNHPGQGLPRIPAIDAFQEYPDEFLWNVHPKDFLISAFIWDETLQNYNYWLELDNLWQEEIKEFV
jgi:hypothetical protein